MQKETNTQKAMTTDRSLVVKAAEIWLGTRETSRNRFVGDSMIWQATNYAQGWQNREPYCAAAVCHWIKQAVSSGMPLSGPLPMMPAVRDWVPWAIKHGHMIADSRFNPAEGDIIVFHPHFSHIGVATGRKFGNYIETIEGNTDDGGSRDGDGFYVRLRPRSIIGSVIRLTLKAEKV